jgi:rhodanese-related sulfurtransferase
MTLVDTKKATEFFDAKLSFTTGPAELNGMMKRGENISIIDVRQPEDYAKGHIPGAASLPKDKWTSFTGLRKEKVNIVYCYSEVCHLAASAAKYFAEHDFPVMELEGGFQEWENYGLPVEK